MTKRANIINHKHVAELVIDGDGEMRFVDPVSKAWISNSRNQRFVAFFVPVADSDEKLLQYAYYYGVVVPIAQLALRDLGYEVSKDQVDLYLKSEILKVPMYSNEGKEIWIPLDKKDMSKEQMTELIENSIELISSLPNGAQYPVPGPHDSQSQLARHLNVAARVQAAWNNMNHGN